MQANSITPLRLRSERSTLLCPHSGQIIERALVVNQTGDSIDYLSSVAHVCKDCHVSPIILTLAGSEDEAYCRQMVAQTVLHDLDLLGDFDYVVASNVVNAVTWAARVRRCAHAFVATDHAEPWWRIWRRDRLKRIDDKSNPITLLTIADVKTPAVHAPLKG